MSQEHYNRPPDPHMDRRDSLIFQGSDVGYAYTRNSMISRSHTPGNESIYPSDSISQAPSTIRQDQAALMGPHPGGQQHQGHEAYAYGQPGWFNQDPYAYPPTHYHDPYAPKPLPMSEIDEMYDHPPPVPSPSHSYYSGHSASVVGQQQQQQQQQYQHPPTSPQNVRFAGVAPSAASSSTLYSYPPQNHHENDDTSLLGNGAAGAGAGAAVAAAGATAANNNNNDRKISSAATFLDDGQQKNNLDNSRYPPSSSVFEADDYIDPRTIPRPPWFKRAIWDTTPTKHKIALYQAGIGVQRRPYACWTLGVVMIAVFIYELVDMAKKGGGSPFVNPKYNPMLGPQIELLVNIGARFTPCMKDVPELSDYVWSCFGQVGDTSCTQTLEEVCGFGGFDGQTPDQNFRFFVPIFLHAGVIHLLFNMVVQMLSSAEVERQMGSIKFVIVYIAAGIFGFVLGGNFALVGQPSVGASGAIYGVHAGMLIDLISHWKIEPRPVRKLVLLIIEIVIGFGLGFVPGVDNFAHIGGFVMGFLWCLLLFPVIHQTRTHKIVFRVLAGLAIPAIIVLYVVLIRNFYTEDSASACEGCRYLSCWPTASNNHCKGTGLQTQTVNSSFSTLLISFISVIWTMIF